jgi:hypothetical protein
MPLFTRVTNTISTYLWPRKKHSTSQAKSPTRRSPLGSLSPNVEGGSIIVQPVNRKKRRASSHSGENTTKKARFSLEGDEDDFEGLTLLTSIKNGKVANPKGKVDRELMPPPSLKKGSRFSKAASSSQVKYPELPDLEDNENKSSNGEQTTRNTRAMSSPIDLESMSSDLKARYQAAMTLPENSGIWAEAERDLFFRLALRGFEPLLPPNWMLDFPTYPLSLYSSENSPAPLLKSLSGNDFRATHALQDLNLMGSRIRDRALLPTPLRPEPIISASVTAYIDWALHDATMHPSQRPAALPVHIVSALQKSQSTHAAITNITAQLHRLAALHRRRRNIRESIERDVTPASDASATHVLSDGDDDTLPILTGLLICSSLVVVVTMNAHAVPASSASVEHEESGLRFIATFDFSEGGMDVWNALAVAIVGMHIRKMMVRQYEIAVEMGEETDWGLIEVTEGNDPDA